MAAPRCPRCGSTDVRTGKVAGETAVLHDWFCNKCQLFEDRMSTAPDFDEWWERWNPREPATKPDQTV